MSTIAFTEHNPSWTEEYTEPVNGYRAVIERDAYPHEPEHDCGCPVLRIEEGDVTFTGYGPVSYKGDGITDSAVDALQRFVSEYGQSDGIRVFERFIRIFHGGTVETHEGHGYRDPSYVAYTTRTMAERAWGFTDDNPPTDEVLKAELTEWMAYVEGDVYGIRVERQVVDWRAATATEEQEWLAGHLSGDDETFYVETEGHGLIVGEGTDWQAVEETDCWGFYGEEYAKEAAIETLRAELKTEVAA